ADLFTSSTLTLMAGVSGAVTWSRVFANWVVVYAGNCLGALFLVGLILLSGHPWESGGEIAAYYVATTMRKLSFSFPEAVGLGILCNLMVCLGVWMSYAGRSVIDKMAAGLFPVGLFISCGFEHSVANMFMIPSGILCFKLAPAEMAARFADPAALREAMTWSNFFLANLLPVTIGNIIGGGVLVGLCNWFVHLGPGGGREARPSDPAR
ncbi:MAG: formate/nitrite transporter family protein, partial [Deltaproteobacteria bacterium]|nr:formate/nitrite transporter family protein [Deltaproteobacteria bacterium]